MRLNKRLGVLLLLFSGIFSVQAQDLLPACPRMDKGTKACKPMREPGALGDTVSVKVTFPVAFRGVGRNEIIDSLGVLTPILERLRLVQNGSSEDTVRIVHIGDSHIRGHIFPRTTGARLTETFGAVSYTDMGVNGATCLTFTHPDRIAAIAALKPELLVLSFGTNESHNRKYNSNVHYRQMEELLGLLRDSLPNVPILLTIISYVFCLLMMRKLNIPWYMTGIIFVSLVVSIICILVNLKWKLSEHMAGMGGIIGGLVSFSALFSYNPVVWLCLFILIAGILGSARIVLGHHTLGEVLSGFVVGLVCAFLVLHPAYNFMFRVFLF